MGEDHREKAGDEEANGHGPAPAPRLSAWLAPWLALGSNNANRGPDRTGGNLAAPARRGVGECRALRAGRSHAPPTWAVSDCARMRSITRRRALLLLGFRWTSTSVGLCDPRNTRRNSARAPHTHGRLGGQVHPPL